MRNIITIERHHVTKDVCTRTLVCGGVKGEEERGRGRKGEEGRGRKRKEEEGRGRKRKGEEGGKRGRYMDDLDKTHTSPRGSSTE